jgi:hypothetical protein
MTRTQGGREQQEGRSGECATNVGGVLAAICRPPVKRGADVTPTGRRKKGATQSCLFVTRDNDPYELRPTSTTPSTTSVIRHEIQSFGRIHPRPQQR